MVVGILATLGLVFGIGGFAPADAAYGPVYVSSASVVYGGLSGRPEVSLTIDCGSDLGNANVMLDTLRQNGISATFGVTGQFAQANPATASRMVREGHQIVNHSYDHPSFTGVSDTTHVALAREERWSQLDRAEAALRADGADSNGWFRPPYGDRDARVDADVAADGYSTELMWTRDTLGWQGIPPAQVVANALRDVHGGSVILMHAGTGSTDYQALPEIIRQIRDVYHLGFAAAGDAVVYGEIGNKYRTLGGGHGFLGWPLTVELDAPNGGRVNRFHNGSIYWTSVTGAYAVYGAIRQKWYDYNGPGGFMGYPLNDESPAANGGRYNAFQKENAYIYWRADVGAHEVQGVIRAKYESFGSEWSFLGYPTSDEMDAGNGSRVSTFQNGHIYWSTVTGAHEVHGQILATYIAAAGPRGPLGMLTSDEFGITGGRQSNFQHGYITWNAATGVTEVHYT